MAEATTIARPYAEAVFALADKAGSLQGWSEALANLAAVAQAPELEPLYGNPKVTATQFVAIFASAARDMPAEARGLLQLLAENKRLQALPAMREHFEELKAAREGAVDAFIVSAYALEGAELAALVADLERRFKRKIRPQVSVDTELIGGARITVGDKVIDGSVRGKLETMNAGLTGG